MIYLASPYSHPNPIIREGRYVSALKYCLFQMEQGVKIFSPIVYGHQFIPHGASIGHEDWHSLNCHLILSSTAVHVLKLPDWDYSRGIAAEIAFAENNGIDVKYVSWI